MQGSVKIKHGQKENPTETITQMGQPSLAGNILTLRFIAENGVEQAVTVDLGSISTTDINVEDWVLDPATGIITLTETDGQEHVLNLSVFNITTEVDVDGITLVSQNGALKFSISKAGSSGQYADLLNIPEGTKKVLTSRLIDATDNGKTLICINAAADITLTVPAGLGVNFSCNVVSEDSGSRFVEIVGPAVTLKAPHGAKILSDYTGNILKRTGEEVFNLQGELTP